MKICLINNLYKPFNRGGAEKVCETIIQGLIKSGHKIFVITTKPRSKKFLNRLPDRQVFKPPAGQAVFKFSIYYLNSCYYSLNKLPKIFHLFWQIWNMFNIMNYFKIKKILKKEKCGAVITNNLMGVGWLTPLAIRSLKIKHWHIAHDIQLLHPSGLMYYAKEGMIDNFFAKIYANVCRWLFRQTPAVIFPSRWLKDLYLKRNFFAQAKVYVLPNPIEMVTQQKSERTGNFTPLEKRFFLTGFKFLFLSQMEKHKGVFLLISAFNKIKEKYPEVELLLVGGGSQLKPAQLKAAANKNIKFLGWPGEEQADKLLFSSNCLIYPSLVYENCPNAIQRALAAGLPVLASNLGGIPELLSHNASILFKPVDVADLAEKMKWMIENKNNLNIIAEAGKRNASVFEAENYIKRLEEMMKL